MSVIKIQESYIDTDTGVVMVKRTDGGYNTYLSTAKVDDAFKLFGLRNVSSQHVKNALNALVVHFAKGLVK